MTAKEGAGLRVMKAIYDRCVEEGECQLWQGATSNNGFPRAYAEGENKHLRTHIYTSILGKLKPKGCAISTKCGHRLCLAENCLTPKSISKIRRDSAEKMRANPLLMERLRAGTKAAGWAKLDMDRAQEIRTSQKTTAELAKEFGVTPSSINKIKRGATYVKPVFATSVFTWGQTL